MHDNTATIQQLKDKIEKFIDERDWQQFHSPKNVSMDIAAEAAELMEFFLWVESKDSYQELEKHREDIEHEVADIAFGLLNFCQHNNIDLAMALEKKIALNAKKYPIEKAKGRATKYNKL